MSHHSVNTKMNGTPVEVVLGWDRQLSCFFVDVSKIIEVTDDEDEFSCPHDEYVYSDYADTAKALSRFKRELNDRNIEVPSELFSIVENDGKHNVGNLVAFYDISNGALKLVSPDVG